MATAGTVSPGSEPAPPGFPQLRLVLAVSLDGRLAPAEGGRFQMGGAGDRRVLEEAMAWADAALVGAETLRGDGSTCLIHGPDLLEQRRQAGRSPQPIAIAVSRSGRLPADLPFFDQPLERWLLQASPVSPGAAPAGFHRRLPLESWHEALAVLGALGQRRLVVLGGARLAEALAAEDLLDELQLTLCPRLLGGVHSWLPPQARVAPAARQGWRLVEHRVLPGEELLLRWRRGPDQGVSS
ncbi:RibD family protein [Synechococcus sp. CCY 9618]|uniref:RibD family protein n=1 Tax=Synechococcus sp. CCY 9618 TaxID=2815602 RepID=UPI00352FC495